MRDINQSRIIQNLNQYLAWHHLPLRVNEGGICRGLASIYAKYAVQGQQDRFFELLDKIASRPSDKTLDDEMNHFVVEIVLSQRPFKKAVSVLRAPVCEDMLPAKISLPHKIGTLN